MLTYENGKKFTDTNQKIAPVTRIPDLGILRPNSWMK
jgi:hypothetical protein